jgi:hypothetical protein
MKRIGVFLLIIISAFFTVNGQQYSIGFKPSFLIISAKYTEEPELMGLNLSSRGSYGFGITLEDQVNKLIGFKVEPRFIAKGYNINWSPEDVDIYKNNYISLPILIDISPIKKFSFEIGTDICYLFSSGVKSSGSQSFQKNDSPNLKHFEFSLVTGVSYLFLKRFDFGVRYGFGLTASDKGTLIISDYDVPQVDYKFVQNYFEFYLNTRFMIKTKNN